MQQQLRRADCNVCAVRRRHGQLQAGLTVFCELTSVLLLVFRWKGSCCSLFSGVQRLRPFGSRLGSGCRSVWAPNALLQRLGLSNVLYRCLRRHGWVCLDLRGTLKQGGT